MKKNYSLIILFLFSLKMISQNGRKTFYGKVLDELGALENAHIVNLNSKQASYSTQNGEFKISVKINDSLKFTSIGYKTKLLVIKPIHLGINETNILLEKEIYELDEIEIKNHNLTGSLALDFKQTPKDKRAEALANTMDFSKVNMKAKTKDDHIDRHIRPPMVQTDPTENFVGAGSKFIMPFKYSEKLWALRKELAFKKSMPAKLLAELGEKFFFQDLKIPVEKYYHFLEYCNPLGIEKLYQEKKTLEVIKILRKEHVSYLKTIKKTLLNKQGF